MSKARANVAELADCDWYFAPRLRFQLRYTAIFAGFESVRAAFDSNASPRRNARLSPCLRSNWEFMKVRAT